MNALTQPQTVLTDEITSGADYQIVRKVIESISENYRDQPSLEELAASVGMEPTALQKLFTRWAGLSPKGFLQAVTLDHARRLLASDLPLLDTAYEVGLSGPGRLHDLFVTHEAMSPGEFKAKGEGLTMRYGFHVCPFGLALVMVTDRGLAGLAFCDPGGEREALDDMCGRWPKAAYIEDMARPAPMRRGSSIRPAGKPTGRSRSC
jgi:AraC family transcriptional regulator of adaptative response/methylated-DNA-[protein]-cysteine methyltransferase